MSALELPITHSANNTNVICTKVSDALGSVRTGGQNGTVADGGRVQGKNVSCGLKSHETKTQEQRYAEHHWMSSCVQM